MLVERNILVATKPLHHFIRCCSYVLCFHDKLFTNAHKIDKGETRIQWDQPAATIKRRINAFSPFPGAWFEIGGERVKALRAGLVDTTSGSPGEVLDDRLTVACGDGAVQLLDVQQAGKKPASAHAFLRGTPIPPGTVLD